MTAGQPKPPDFEIVRRLMRLPVVRSGLNAAASVYWRLKASKKHLFPAVFDSARCPFVTAVFSCLAQTSNGTVARGLDTAEKTAMTVAGLSGPFVNNFGDHIDKIDQLMCKSLDAVERNVPMVSRSPREV